MDGEGRRPTRNWRGMWWSAKVAKDHRTTQPWVGPPSSKPTIGDAYRYTSISFLFYPFFFTTPRPRLKVNKSRALWRCEYMQMLMQCSEDLALHGRDNTTRLAKIYGIVKTETSVYFFSIWAICGCLPRSCANSRSVRRRFLSGEIGIILQVGNCLSPGIT